MGVDGAPVSFAVDASPYPSPPAVRTEGSLRPPSLWKDRSVAGGKAVSAVEDDMPEWRQRVKNAGDIIVVRCVLLLGRVDMGGVLVVAVGGADEGSARREGGSANSCLRSRRFFSQRRRIRSTKRRMVRPATPPTTPPTTVGVGGPLDDLCVDPLVAVELAAPELEVVPVADPPTVPTVAPVCEGVVPPETSKYDADADDAAAELLSSEELRVDVMRVV